MAKAGGYIFKAPKERIALFEECFNRNERFSEPVDDFSHARSAPLVCFIVLDSSYISHIARGRKGLVAGTELRRLNIEEPVCLDMPISITDIINTSSKKFSGRIESLFHKGGMITPKTFEEIVDVISSLSPEAASLLKRFSRQRSELIAKITRRVRENLSEQKEAVTTALAIAGFDKSEILEWSPPIEETPNSFLDGLPSAVMREDSMIINDLMNIPGFELIKTFPYSAAVFQGDGKTLTVLLTNRLPLEKLLGTDLIYFNETYRSFVMVQYKAMEKHEHGPLFRLPSKQLDEEISRMVDVESELAAHTGANSIDDYRISEFPFFLKLCSRMNFNPDDTKLFPGMYFPLAQWKLLEKSPAIIGPKGGKAISYENAGRYMDNNFFVSLVSGAWIGTNSQQSVIIERIIRSTLASGRAIALASLTNN